MSGTPSRRAKRNSDRTRFSCCGFGAVGDALLGGSSGDLPVGAGLGLGVVSLEESDDVGEALGAGELDVSLQMRCAFGSALVLVDEEAASSRHRLRVGAAGIVEGEHPAARGGGGFGRLTGGCGGGGCCWGFSYSARGGGVDLVLSLHFEFGILL